MAAPGYETEIAALEAAAATGELTVESDGDRVTYRSTADLLKTLDYFRRMAAAAVSASRPRAVVAVFDPE